MTTLMNTASISSTEEILAATAHELRLPLSHIKGFVSSLRRTDVEWDDETRSEFIAEIDQETDRLAELVDSLLGARATDKHSKPGADVTFTHPAAVVEGGTPPGVFAPRTPSPDRRADTCPISPDGCAADGARAGESARECGQILAVRRTYRHRGADHARL